MINHEDSKALADAIDASRVLCHGWSLAFTVNPSDTVADQRSWAAQKSAAAAAASRLSLADDAAPEGNQRVTFAGLKSEANIGTGGRAAAGTCRHATAADREVVQRVLAPFLHPVSPPKRHSSSAVAVANPFGRHRCVFLRSHAKSPIVFAAHPIIAQYSALIADLLEVYAAAEEEGAGGAGGNGGGLLSGDEGADDAPFISLKRIAPYPLRHFRGDANAALDERSAAQQHQHMLFSDFCSAAPHWAAIANAAASGAADSIPLNMIGRGRTSGDHEDSEQVDRGREWRRADWHNFYGEHATDIKSNPMYKEPPFAMISNPDLTTADTTSSTLLSNNVNVAVAAEAFQDILFQLLADVPQPEAGFITSSPNNAGLKGEAIAFRCSCTLSMPLVTASVPSSPPGDNAGETGGESTANVATPTFPPPVAAVGASSDRKAEGCRGDKALVIDVLGYDDEVLGIIASYSMQLAMKHYGLATTGWLQDPAPVLRGDAEEEMGDGECSGDEEHLGDEDSEDSATIGSDAGGPIILPPPPPGNSSGRLPPPPSASFNFAAKHRPKERRLAFTIPTKPPASLMMDSFYGRTMTDPATKRPKFLAAYRLQASGLPLVGFGGGDGLPFEKQRLYRGAPAPSCLPYYAYEAAVARHYLLPFMGSYRRPHNPTVGSESAMVSVLERIAEHASDADVKLFLAMETAHCTAAAANANRGGGRASSPDSSNVSVAFPYAPVPFSFSTMAFMLRLLFEEEGRIAAASSPTPSLATLAGMGTTMRSTYEELLEMSGHTLPSPVVDADCLLIRDSSGRVEYASSAAHVSLAAFDSPLKALAILSTMRAVETRALADATSRATSVMNAANFLQLQPLVELCGLSVAMMARGRELADVKALFGRAVAYKRDDGEQRT